MNPEPLDRVTEFSQCFPMWVNKYVTLGKSDQFLCVIERFSTLLCLAPQSHHSAASPRLSICLGV